MNNCKSFLRCVIYSCILVTHGPRQRYRKSRASQSCTQFATEVRASAGRVGRDGSRLLGFTTPSLSLSPASKTIEAACCCGRREDCLHRQAFRKAGRTAALLRRQDRLIVERDRESSIRDCARAEDEAWVNGQWVGATGCSWNTGLIVCSRPDWNRPTNYWYPTRDGPVKATEAKAIQENINEQTGGHLCSSIFRSAEGESDHRQSDVGPEAIRRNSRISGAGRMGV